MSLAVLISGVIGFCVGVTIESVTNQSVWMVVWLLFLACIMAVVWRRAGSSARPAPYLALVSVFLLTISLGLFRTTSFESQFDQSLVGFVGSEQQFTGVVIGDPDVRTAVQMLEVAYQNETILVSTDRAVPIAYGDTVIVTGILEVPTSFTTDLGRTFDYGRYLAAKEIEYRISFADVSVIATGGGNSVLRTLFALKHWFMAELDQVFTEPAGSLADGLLLGLNQGLGDQLEEDFRRSGIIHIVVLSGYNIMLVVGFTLFIFSFFLAKRWRLLFGLLAIAAFALIVGPSATVVRASIMAGVLLLAQSLNRSYDVLRALLLAGTIMLIVNPYLLLFDIGFQLSFMATLGLIAALPWLDSGAQPELLTNVRGYVVATIATQIAVLPLLIYHIGEVSVVSVMVNVLVLPVVPVAMLGAFLAGLAHALFAPLGLVLGFITQFSLQYIIVVAEWFSALPFATVRFAAVSPWAVVALYVLLGYGYWWLVFSKRKDSGSTVTFGQGYLADWTIEEEFDMDSKTVADHRSATATVPKMFR